MSIKHTICKRLSSVFLKKLLAVFCAIGLVFCLIPTGISFASTSDVNQTDDAALYEASEPAEQIYETVELAASENGSVDEVSAAELTAFNVSSESSGDETNAVEAGIPAATSLENGEGETNAVGTLNVQLSNSSGGYDDVTSFTDQTTDWPLGELRTLKMDFMFSSGTDKTITVNVPTGYTIVGYSATDTTATKSGVQNIEIDQQYKEYVASSTLMGTDGTTAWEDQALPGKYLGIESIKEIDARTYGGLITYSFTESAEKGALVVTLKPQCETLSHTATSEGLDAVYVSMSSNQGSIGSSFFANVTGIKKATIDIATHDVWGVYTANVAYDPDTGLTDRFGIICSSSCYDSNGYGEQPFYTENLGLTIEYPIGVSFDDEIFCQYYRLNNYAISADEEKEIEVIPNHLTLTITGSKATGGTVVFSFKNTVVTHNYYENLLGAYFVADSYSVTSDELVFPVAFTYLSQGKSFSYTRQWTRTLLQAPEGNYLINITPKNAYRRDLNAAYPDYPYDYALGGFNVDCKLSYSNVHLSYDFSKLAGVRGIGAPGYNIRDIIVITTKENTKTLSNVADSVSRHIGAPITAEKLGLDKDEYIKTLTCTIDLEQQIYSYTYIRGMSYYGHFVDGQEGDVVLSILNEDGSIACDGEEKELQVIDHTTIRWNSSGGKSMSTNVYDEAGNQVTTFYPNKKIHLNSKLSGGAQWCDATTIVDPIIMISFPKGINLDTSSVTALSYYGNHPNEIIPLIQVKTPLIVEIDGVEWTTYYFTSKKSLDMVAMESYPGTSCSDILIEFNAYISSSSPDYGQISLSDCVQWDLNVTSVDSSSGMIVIDKDSYNRAGKGTTYMVHESTGSFTVKPLIGLNVDLGIRIKDSGTDYYTYDTRADSIAGITREDPADVRISYQNTSDTSYFKDSAIYLPVPKVSKDYKKYFQNNAVSDPQGSESLQAFEFDTYLKTPVNLSRFTTYYAVEVEDKTDTYSSDLNATWEPVTATNWYTYDDLQSAGKSLDDVVFLKFVAYEDIPTGESSEATFELTIDKDTHVDLVNYWRAYTKAVTDNTDNTGTWNYSSVLAATPVCFSACGQLFLDNDRDGCFDINLGDDAYTRGFVSAILSRDDGTMGNIALTINDDGSFQVLNESGKTQYLKSGDYTITFTNTDEAFVFSSKKGTSSSSSETWFNDITPTDSDGKGATCHFTISSSTSTDAYIGVALTVINLSIDVPVKVQIGVKATGEWITPTASKNMLINHSAFPARVSSATTQPTSEFTLRSANEATSSTDDNVFGGTIKAGSGTAQDLSSISTSDATWTMAAGSASDESNQLPLQLTGSLANVEHHYFVYPIQVFNMQYAFEIVL